MRRLSFLESCRIVVHYRFPFRAAEHIRSPSEECFLFCSGALSVLVKFAHMPLYLHRSMIRVALFAALLHALSATASYLGASADGVRVVEICSSFGIERIHLDADGNPVDAPQAHHSPYCDYCAAGQLPVNPAKTHVLEEVLDQFVPGSNWSPHLNRFPQISLVAHRPRAPPLRG